MLGDKEGVKGGDGAEAVVGDEASVNGRELAGEVAEEAGGAVEGGA